MRMLLQTICEGASHAAALLPLLYGAYTAPAHAQLPRAISETTAVAPPNQPLDNTGSLALASRHITIRVVGAQAQVRTHLTYRNDTMIAAKSSSLFVEGARQVTADNSTDCGDLDAEDAQFIEGGEAPPHQASVDPEVAPGKEITIETLSTATVFARGAQRRLVLPLPRVEHALLAPAFSASVEVVADTPVTTLGSATHGGHVTGIGERIAQLDIANGRVVTIPFLTVEYELGELPPAFHTSGAAPMFQINARVRR